MKTLTQQISEILFNLDPMNTGCKENDLQDEYLVEAGDIAYLMKYSRKMPFESMVNGTFNERFWEGCLTQEVLNSIANKIKEL